MHDDPGKTLVKQAFDDLGETRSYDYHAHLIGGGTDGAGTELDPDLLAGWNPVKRIKGAIFLQACGVSDLSRVDSQYLDRLIALARDFPRPPLIHLLALDHAYGPDGVPAPDPVEFFVPNCRIFQIKEQYPDLIAPVVSVHPDRPDARAELEAWANRGVRYVKWLPNAQGMDPSLARHDAFYETMRKHGLALITHTGLERSVGSGNQAFGSPLLLRRPLDHGVKVIMAHCASTGWNADLDHPGVRARNFDLFLRIMDDPRYRGLAFGDLSALTQVNRAPGPILALIRRPDLHDRLVNGTDYPLPALNIMIWTRQLAWLGLITKEERLALNAIYRVNPMLFDFVLKRTIRDPETGARLPPRIFMKNPNLP